MKGNVSYASAGLGVGTSAGVVTGICGPHSAAGGFLGAGARCGLAQLHSPRWFLIAALMANKAGQLCFLCQETERGFHQW